MAASITINLKDATPEALDALVTRLEKAAESADHLGAAGKTLDASLKQTGQNADQLGKTLESATARTGRFADESRRTTMNARDLNAVLRESGAAGNLAAGGLGEASDGLNVFNAVAIRSGISGNNLAFALKAATVGFVTLNPWTWKFIIAGYALRATIPAIVGGMYLWKAANAATERGLGDLVGALASGGGLAGALSAAADSFKKFSTYAALGRVELLGQRGIWFLAKAEAYGFGKILTGLSIGFRVLGAATGLVQPLIAGFGTVLRVSAGWIDQGGIALLRYSKTLGETAKSYAAQARSIGDLGGYVSWLNGKLDLTSGSLRGMAGRIVIMSNQLRSQAAKEIGETAKRLEYLSDILYRSHKAPRELGAAFEILTQNAGAVAQRLLIVARNYGIGEKAAILAGAATRVYANAQYYLGVAFEAVGVKGLNLSGRFHYIADTLYGLRSTLTKALEAFGKAEQTMGKTGTTVQNATGQFKQMNGAAGNATQSMGLFGGSLLALGAGFKLIHSAVKTFEDLKHAAEGVRVSTGLTAKEATTQAIALRQATGSALSLGEAMRALSRANEAGLGFAQTEQIIAIATLRAQRLGEEVPGFVRQVLDAAKQGSADTLQQLGLLSGGLDVVRARFDQTAGYAGAFDKLSESIKRTVVQAELMGEAGTLTKALGDDAFGTAGSVQNLRGALSDAWTAFAQGFGSGRAGAVFNQLAESLRTDLIPWLAKIPDLMAGATDSLTVFTAYASEGFGWLGGWITRLFRMTAELGQWMVGFISTDLAHSIDGLLESTKKYETELIDGASQRLEFLGRAVEARRAVLDTLAKSELEKRERTIGVEKQLADKMREENRLLLTQANIREQIADINKSIGEGVRGGGGSSGLAGSVGGPAGSARRTGIAGGDAVDAIRAEFDRSRNDHLGGGLNIDAVVSSAKSALADLANQRKAIDLEAAKRAEQLAKENVAFELRIRGEARRRLNAGEDAAKVQAGIRKQIADEMELRSNLEREQAAKREKQLDAIEDKEKRITDEVKNRLNLQLQREQDQVKKLLDALNQKFGAKGADGSALGGIAATFNAANGVAGNVARPGGAQFFNPLGLGLGAFQGETARTPSQLRAEQKTVKDAAAQAKRDAGAASLIPDEARRFGFTDDKIRKQFIKDAQDKYEDDAQRRRSDERERLAFGGRRLDDPREMAAFKERERQGKLRAGADAARKFDRGDVPADALGGAVINLGATLSKDLEATGKASKATIEAVEELAKGFAERIQVEAQLAADMELIKQGVEGLRAMGRPGQRQRNQRSSS